MPVPTACNPHSVSVLAAPLRPRGRARRPALAALALALAACDSGDGRDVDQTGGAATAGKFEDTSEVGHPNCPETPASCIPPGLGCEDVRYVAAAESGREPRGEGPLDTIVIHKAEGDGYTSLTGGRTSAHFFVGREGEIVCIVPPAEIAHHLSNDGYNARIIGIEQAGWSNADDVTEAQMDALIGLVDGLVEAYGIPADRDHVIGHVEIPKTDATLDGCGGDSGHSDPGVYFAYDALMAGIGTDPGAELVAERWMGWQVLEIEAPAVLAPAQEATVTVTLRNTGSATWENHLLRLRTATDVTQQFRAGYDTTTALGWRLPNELAPAVTSDAGPAGCYGPVRVAELSFQVKAPTDPGCAEGEATCTRTLTFVAFAKLRPSGEWAEYPEVAFDVDLQLAAAP